MKNLYQEIPLLQQEVSTNSTANKMAKGPLSQPPIRKTVSFSEYDFEMQVTSLRDYTPMEIRSVWYTDKDYGVFALNELKEKMSSLDEQKKKHKRMLRIESVRRSVLKSQADQMLRKKMRDTNNEYSTWLAKYVKKYTEQSAIEARQRGMENDLEILKMKMQEMNSRSTRPAFRTKIDAVKASNKNSNNRNARWSSNPKDVAPGVIERSSSLRKLLRTDLCSEPKPPVIIQMRLDSPSHRTC